MDMPNSHGGIGKSKLWLIDFLEALPAGVLVRVVTVVIVWVCKQNRLKSAFLKDLMAHCA